MKEYKIEFSGTISGTLSLEEISPQPPDLIFEDNFNGTDLNPALWNKVSQGLYQQSQIGVANSNLIIKGELVNGVPRSGYVNTTDKFNFKYGMIEFRAKYAHGDGARNQMWCSSGPANTNAMNIEDAISLDNKNNPPCEVRDVNKSATTLSGGGHGGEAWCIKPTPNNFQDYHLYQMDWTPEHVIFKFDNVEQYRLTGTKVPIEPVPIKIALCLGKCGVTWGKDLNTSQLPFEFMIDYVKIYKR